MSIFSRQLSWSPHLPPSEKHGMLTQPAGHMNKMDDVQARVVTRASRTGGGKPQELTLRLSHLVIDG